MLLAKTSNLGGIYLTKSDTDGTFLHFDAGGEEQAGLRLDTLENCSSVILLWAEKQLLESLSRTDMERRLKAHSAGEAVKHFCRECRKPFWNVDDEPIICPHCGSKEMPVHDIDAEQIA